MRPRAPSAPAAASCGSSPSAWCRSRSSTRSRTTSRARRPGQFTLPLSADPFGFGWDLFGAIGDYEPNLAPFSPNTVWYVQVGALVAGYVAGLAVAHDRAVTLFRERDAALRSQYAMLALMVLYTVGGMWLLSQG